VEQERAMINTKRVRDRRKVRFETFDEAIADAEMLAAAERNGTLRALGNWTLGQAIGHIAYWADAPFDGYPKTPPLPWLLRVLLPLLKNGFLNKKLPAGARIPGTPDGTFGVDVLPTDEALGRLQSAFDRLAKQKPTRLNPVFGEMTHAEWIKLNLRHAELHLSFLKPE
jgi:Protein of unknown function (DUF1569)